jgi:2-C-methyl-D-erythritol 2,4-cyclodiphosphate synthase
MSKIPFRIGHGYDLHRLTVGRKLILGGVEIPHEQGLLGHSDADCLTHALADAIFGALGLPDIGHYFPDDAPENKDMDSMRILDKAVEECVSAGYSVGNADLTILAESPKMAPYMDAIKDSLAKPLMISPSQIGLKATTNEGLGAIGREEGIASFAVCLLVKVNKR